MKGPDNKSETFSELKSKKKRGPKPKFEIFDYLEAEKIGTAQTPRGQQNYIYAAQAYHYLKQEPFWPDELKSEFEERCPRLLDFFGRHGTILSKIGRLRDPYLIVVVALQIESGKNGKPLRGAAALGVIKRYGGSPYRLFCKIGEMHRLITIAVKRFKTLHPDIQDDVTMDLLRDAVNQEIEKLSGQTDLFKKH